MKSVFEICCQVGFHTDGGETDTATAGDIEMSKGFNLYYSQVAC